LNSSLSLVQPLFDGPIDVVGDVHGEIDALRSLLQHLGYSHDGKHPKGRRLVFVGDLTDRGPDSPSVVDLVKSLVDSGRAQCVLGNHDLNILLGDRKHDNHWFYGEEWALDGSDAPTPAILADDKTRQRVLDFFKSLPLVLERSDLRIDHACWDDEMVNLLRQVQDVVAIHRQYASAIESCHEGTNLDGIERELEHQNRNPVKVITSGKEQRITTPFFASGRVRYEERVQWWKEYDADQLCVFGHYSNYRGEFSRSGRAICVDFAVAKRWYERKHSSFDGTFRGCLGAIRIPEDYVVIDSGDQERMGCESR
jgi:hypothetical protein